MKLNVIGFAAAIIALTSIFLPWWGVSLSGMSLNVYPWGITMHFPAEWEVDGIAILYAHMWYAPTAMALVVVGAILGLVGSSMTGKRGKILIASAGVLTVLSVIMFVAGLVFVTGLAPELIFKTTTYFSTYLSLGFLQALVAAVLAFVSLASEPRSPVLSQYKMKKIEVCLLIGFMILLYASIIFGLVLHMPLISLLLIFIDFPIAAIVAVFASLAIREEEEAKSS